MLTQVIKIETPAIFPYLILPMVIKKKKKI